MDIAQNRHGAVIHAGVAQRGERYVCPECKNRVKFCAAGERVAHFKHTSSKSLSGSNRIRCERCSLYNSHLGGSLQPQQTRTASRLPPRAVLAVGWRTTPSGPERWALYVSLPIPPSAVELVWVEGNINGESWLPRVAVAKQRLFPVRAATKQYQVRYRCHRDALSLGAVPVIQPTDALDNAQANVFDAGTGGGRQLCPDEPLVRGRCYFTLTKKPGVWTPPPGNGSRAVPGSKDCDPKGEWEGHLIYVPAAKDAVFAAWSGRVCGRAVVAPPAGIELIYPPVTDTRPDGTLLIPAGESVLLALRGDWSEPEVEIWREDAATTSVVEYLSVTSDEVLVIKNLPVGVHSIYAVEASQAFIQIEVANPVELALPALSIRTEIRETGQELRGELHDANGPLRWSGLLSGVEGWGAIDFPPSFPVEFRCRVRGQEQVRRETATTPAQLAELLGKCLAAEPLFAQIDAGVFGSADWAAPATVLSPVEPQDVQRRSMPRALRERLEWLLTTAVRHREAKAIPVGVRVFSGWEGRVHPQDVSTVSKFLRVHSWPEPLVAHARAVAKDIRNHLSI